MGAGIDVVINLRASKLAGRDGLRRVVAAAAEEARARVHETESLDALERTAREIAARGTEAVILAGGDGSYMAGLTALTHAYGARPLPPVALAPGGTVCTVARNFGTVGRVDAWARRIVRSTCDGTARAAPRATLRVTDDRGGDRVGFIFGAGLVVRFFDAYYAGSRQGRAAAAGLVARIFGGSFAGGRLAKTVLEPTRCSLSVDGQLEPTRRWSLILASVVRDVGLHMLVPYRAGEELERFHVVASGLSPRALAKQLPRALLGRPLRGQPRIDSLARSLEIVFEERFEQRFDEGDGGYVLDGDRLPARAAMVKPGPVVSILRPP